MSRACFKGVLNFLFAFSDDLKVELVGPNELSNKPPVEELGFGKYFTDHMLRIKWTHQNGWEPPVITKLQNFQMHPAAKVRHLIYYTGMK